MALQKCKECGHEVSDKAAACQHCGAKVKKKMGFMKKALIGLVGLWVLGVVLNLIESSNHSTDGNAVTESRELPVNPAKVEEQTQPNPFTWQYADVSDDMGKGMIKVALVKSIYELEFEFPYAGKQRATLKLRNHPRYGRDVILSVDKGQFVCGATECVVKVRFGDGVPQTFAAAPPSDYSSTTLFIKNHDRFLSAMKKADDVSIEATFYQAGNKVMKFATSDLKW